MRALLPGFSDDAKLAPVEARGMLRFSVMARWMFAFSAACAACVALTGCLAKPTHTSSVPDDSCVDAARNEDVELVTPTGTLHGTRRLPAGRGPFASALIIAGSGPTDRNGNSPLGSPDLYRKLAEALSDVGVASLRYDKRGVADSAPALTHEEDVRVETLVDDAVGWLRWWKLDRRVGPLIVVGHSEGALLGTLAVQQEPVQGFVALAAAGRKLGVLLREQMRARLPAQLRPSAESILARLEAGSEVTQVPAELMALFRPSVQPYMMSLLRYDPAAELAKLSLPTLLVQGTTDIQVSMVDAKALARARPAATLLTVKGMNHVLKRVPEGSDQRASYANGTLPLAPALVDGLHKFFARYFPHPIERCSSH